MRTARFVHHEGPSTTVEYAIYFDLSLSVCHGDRDLWREGLVPFCIVCVRTDFVFLSVCFSLALVQMLAFTYKADDGRDLKFLLVIMQVRSFGLFCDLFFFSNHFCCETSFFRVRVSVVFGVELFFFLLCKNENCPPGVALFSKGVTKGDETKCAPRPSTSVLFSFDVISLGRRMRRFDSIRSV